MPCRLAYRCEAKGVQGAKRCYEERLTNAMDLERRRVSQESNCLEEEVKTLRLKGTSKRESGPRGQEKSSSVGETAQGSTSPIIR